MLRGVLPTPEATLAQEPFGPAPTRSTGGSRVYTGRTEVTSGVKGFDVLFEGRSGVEVPV